MTNSRRKSKLNSRRQSIRKSRRQSIRKYKRRSRKIRSRIKGGTKTNTQIDPRLIGLLANQNIKLPSDIQMSLNGEIQAYALNEMNATIKNVEQITYKLNNTINIANQKINTAFKEATKLAKTQYIQIVSKYNQDIEISYMKMGNIGYLLKELANKLIKEYT